MDKQKIGFALTGSFCTFRQAIPAVMKLMEKGYDVTPVFSEFSYATDTRFGRARDFVCEMEGITGHEAIHTIVGAEPAGPQKLFDLLIIAPCTGNTLGKLNCGITDTCVTMAAKAHLRNERPLLIAVSTNDALGISSKNIGGLLSCRNVFFVPMRQDQPEGKPRSVVADFTLLPQAAEHALGSTQIQPIYIA